MKKTILFILCFSCLVASSCSKDDNDPPPVLPESCDQIVTFVDSSVRVTIPTAFTPNGDGLNDLYEVLAILRDTTDFEYAVHQLNGDLVFQSNSIHTRWDGRTNGGDILSDSLFRLQLRFRNFSGIIIDTCSYVYKLNTSGNGCVRTGNIDTTKLVFLDMIDPSTMGIVFPTNEHFCL